MSNLNANAPRTGKPLEAVAITPLSEIPHVVRKARDAHIVFQRHSYAELDKKNKKFRERFLAEAQRFSEVLINESGKVAAEAWFVDILPLADLVAFWTGDGLEHLRSVAVSLDPTLYPRKKARVVQRARGVVLLITPWNFPLAIPLRTLIPALLAGNTIIWKPSEHTPRVAQALVELAVDVFGEGVVSLVQGGADQAQALIAGGVDAVVFTGGERGGRAIAQAAAEALIPAALELGGKDAAVVFDDADLERTAAGIVWGAYANAGQNCASIERVYVTAKKCDALLQRINLEIKALRLGEEVAAMGNQPQYDRICSQIAELQVEENIFCAHQDLEKRAGLWVAPRVVRIKGSTVIEREMFGPVLSVIEVQNIDEAISAINNHPLGLTASLWTRDIAYAKALACGLDVGVVTINNHGLTAAIPALPWSGVRRSGFGITNSPRALDVLTRPQVVFVDRASSRELWWFPYNQALVNMARALVTLRRSSTSIIEKCKAVVALLSNLLRRHSDDAS